MSFCFFLQCFWGEGVRSYLHLHKSNHLSQCLTHSGVHTHETRASFPCPSFLWSLLACKGVGGCPGHWRRWGWQGDMEGAEVFLLSGPSPLAWRYKSHENYEVQTTAEAPRSWGVLGAPLFLNACWLALQGGTDRPHRAGLIASLGEVGCQYLLKYAYICTFWFSNFPFLNFSYHKKTTKNKKHQHARK